MSNKQKRTEDKDDYKYVVKKSRNAVLNLLLEHTILYTIYYTYT